MVVPPVRVQVRIGTRADIDPEVLRARLAVFGEAFRAACATGDHEFVAYVVGQHMGDLAAHVDVVFDPPLSEDAS